MPHKSVKSHLVQLVSWVWFTPVRKSDHRVVPVTPLCSPGFFFQSFSKSIIFSKVTIQICLFIKLKQNLFSHIWTFGINITETSERCFCFFSSGVAPKTDFQGLRVFSCVTSLRMLVNEQSFQRVIYKILKITCFSSVFITLLLYLHYDQSGPLCPLKVCLPDHCNICVSAVLVPRWPFLKRHF